MQKLLKKYLFIALSVILIVSTLLSLVGCSSSNTTEVATVDEASTAPPTTAAPVIKKQIYIVCSDESEQGNLALQGFSEGLNANGYLVGEVVEIVVGKSTNKDKPDYKQQAKDAVDAKPDLIYAVGEEAAKACADATKEIPIIFANIADPIAQGLLTSCEKPDKNITGVSDFVPVFQQLEYAKYLYPKAAKISVLYGEKEENSILIASLIKAESKEFMLTCNTFTAENEDDIEDAVSAAVKDCDILYVPEDDVISSKLSAVLKSAKENSIPVFTSDSLYVNKGALATSVYDYINIGNEAAKMSIVVLEGLKTVPQMSVYYPNKCTNIVNQATAKALNLSIATDKYSVILVPTTE